MYNLYIYELYMNYQILWNFDDYCFVFLSIWSFFFIYIIYFSLYILYKYLYKLKK